jgi:hypothetical protein
MIARVSPPSQMLRHPSLTPANRATAGVIWCVASTVLVRMINGRFQRLLNNELRWRGRPDTLIPAGVPTLAMLNPSCDCQL